MTNKHAMELDIRAMQSTDTQPTVAPPASTQVETESSPAGETPDSKESTAPAPASSHSPVSFPQSEGSPPPTSPQVRARVTSLMHRGTEAVHNFSSPLAQIYQPLVVDDDLVDEAPESSSSANQKFVFPRRRRLSSVHKFPPTDHHASAVALRKFPTNSSSRGPGLTEQTLSESPFDADEESPKREPETVEQIANEAATNGGDTQVMHRLHRIEQQQKRLEELLVQLSKDIRR